MEKNYLAQIIATDNEGLQMISACISGAKTKVANIKYLAANKVFLLSIERNKIEKFLKSQDIEFYSKKGPRTLIIPVINYQKRLILWDDPNPWFDVWLRRPLDSNLNLFTLPAGEADDLIKLNSYFKTIDFKKIESLSSSSAQRLKARWWILKSKFIDNPALAIREAISLYRKGGCLSASNKLGKELHSLIQN